MSTISMFVTIAIFLIIQLITAVWWGSKMDTQVSALWKNYDAMNGEKGKFAELMIKVDTMWAFQMRRALSEAVEKGVGTINSPIVFKEDVLAVLNPIKPKLIELYKSKKQQDLDDLNILLEIEREFGDALFKDVCIPYKLSHGACLVMALSVAKNDVCIKI